MQTASSRIWNRFAMSISYNDNPPPHTHTRMHMNVHTDPHTHIFPRLLSKSKVCKNVVTIIDLFLS